MVTGALGGPIQPLNPGPVLPLTAFYQNWKEAELLPNLWLDRTLRRGYALQFARKPPSFCGVLKTRLRSSAAVIQEEITSLLQRGAVVEVAPEQARKGFYSPYFLVPKKSGGMRPILDLRVLNAAIVQRPFRMLTVKQLLECVRPGDWMTSVDLKDAYFHIPIVPEHRKFLRFAVGESCYEYQRLPFGYSLAPRTFSKCVEAALEPLRRQGFRILTYIDDWLILAPSREGAQAHTAILMDHVSRLGLVINREKSVLCPTQCITYLGLRLDSRRMCASLSLERQEALMSLGNVVLVGNRVPSHSVRSLLGMMAAAHPVVRLGLLHMRALQRWFSRLKLHPLRDRRRTVTPSALARSDVVFWLTPGRLSQGVRLGCVPSYTEVFTDASLTGWGGVLGQQATGGIWASSRRHINLLEMEAVQKVLLHFAIELKGHHVMVRSDNTTVVAYLNRQGGTRSPALHRKAMEILLWADSHLASLKARHIPGVLNLGADRMSRGGPLHDEWSLAPEIAEEVWRHFGRPVADLFASAENAQCPLWFSLRLADEPPLGVDALAHRVWPEGLLYAFPPTRLLVPLLHRVSLERLLILVVAPDSPNARWYPDLVGMALEDPWPLPDRTNTLIQAGGALQSRPVIGRRLMVWKLRGRSYCS